MEENNQPAPLPAQTSTLPGVQNMFKQAWDLFNARKTELLTISGVVYLIIGISSFFLYGTNYASPTPNMLTPTFGLGFLIYMIVAAVLGIVSEAAIILAFTKQPQTSATDLVSEGFNKFWKLLITLIIGGILTAIGFVLLIIPGIIIAVFFSLSVYIAVLESESGFDALKKSYNYIKGHWWAVFGRLLAVIVAAVIINIPISIIAGIEPYTGMLINIIYSAILMPFVLAYGYIIYGHLKDNHTI